jgi:cytochrome c peroxidase
LKIAHHFSSQAHALRILAIAGLLTGLLSQAIAQTPPPPPKQTPQPVVQETRLESLGRRIFGDKNLSEPAGMSCATCHTPNTGFANNNGSGIGVPLGSRSGVFGLRNAMSNAYGTFVPPFSFRVMNGDIDPVGGYFWDGRADTLALQALGPFLASEEMNNPNVAAVVKKVAASNYADLMRAEFGATIFNTPDLAYQKIGIAIAAFEATNAFQQFSSKYDAFVQGKTTLSASESNGMKLFMDPNRGNCASCHTMNPASKNPKDSLFADFAFYAIGVPRNKSIPANANPSFFDLGLCGPQRTRPALSNNLPADVSIEKFCGTFRMVSLRNTAERKAWMHNGVFKSLQEVVNFYSTRNSDPKRWYGPAGVPNDLPAAYIGNIISDRVPFNRPASAGPVFTRTEADDVVAFLRTLSDGFISNAPPPPAARPPLPPSPAARPSLPPPPIALSSSTKPQGVK